MLFCSILAWLSQGCMEDMSDCVSRSGAITTRTVELPPFHSITARDGIHVKLQTAEDQQLSVIAGENVQPQISLKVIDGTLIIEDHNRCDWSRQYRERIVRILLPRLSRIEQEGFGSITSEDTLEVEALLIQARRGIGEIDLKVKAQTLNVVSSRYGTISLAGETKRLKVQYLSNNAIFKGSQLQAQEIDVFQKSNNDFHLYPVKLLQGKLLRRGNIYLYHPPERTAVEISGKGRIIPLY